MKLPFFAGRFTKWLRSPRKTLPVVRRRSLKPSLEALEDRTLFSATPSILSIKLFDPATGATLSPTNTGPVDPSIAVQFNEAMDAQSVTDPTNYVVFNTSGTQINVAATSFRPFATTTNTEIIDLGRVDTTITA